MVGPSLVEGGSEGGCSTERPPQEIVLSRLEHPFKFGMVSVPWSCACLACLTEVAVGLSVAILAQACAFVQAFAAKDHRICPPHLAAAGQCRKGSPAQRAL